jgi:hypothetical protein
MFDSNASLGASREPSIHLSALLSEAKARKALFALAEIYRFQPEYSASKAASPGYG